ncbi:MAG TPA: DMT family transporter [Chitinophagaceae bacterium]|nr:DMT family transporter [Chitinophagaceae bacterium]
MKYLLMFATLAAGALLPVQAVLNTRLGRQTGGPLMGSLLSFVVGLIALLLLILVTQPGSVPQLRSTQAGPWYVWLGGLLGAMYVGYITWVNQQQGVALTFALVVSGQMLISLVIDHFGLLGSAVRMITLEKLIGAALIIVGLVLIKR